MSEIIIPNAIIDIVLNGRKSKSKPNLKIFTNYLQREIKFLRTGFATNYGLNQIYLVVQDLINRYHNYIAGNDDAYPQNSIVLSSGIQVRSSMILVIKRAKMYSALHANELANEAQNIDNHLNNEKLYIVNLSEPQGSLKEASVSDMLDYLETINKVLTSFNAPKSKLVHLINQINPLITKFFYV